MLRLHRCRHEGITLQPIRESHTESENDERALSGEARFEAQRQEQSITHLVRIRWRAGVTSEMRFVIGARKLVIQSAYDPDERRRFLICRCEEIAA